MVVKEAVERAAHALPEVFPEAKGRALRSEGVEKTEDSRFWKITLSYTEGDQGLEALSREYKTIKLRDSDGEFIGARAGVLLEAL